MEGVARRSACMFNFVVERTRKNSTNSSDPFPFCSPKAFLLPPDSVYPGYRSLLVKNEPNSAQCNFYVWENVSANVMPLDSERNDAVVVGRKVFMI